jgi:hypothetical protein
VPEEEGVGSVRHAAAGAAQGQERAVVAGAEDGIEDVGVGCGIEHVRE